MYLGTRTRRCNAGRVWSDTSSVALRTRLLAGVTGYAAQCRALSPRTDATPHVQGASPMRQQSGGSQSMVSSVTNLSIGEPLVEPVEAPALADAGLQAAEYRTARKRLYRETIRFLKRGRSARAKAILEKHPGISPRLFFQKYWAGKCWQYASALAYHASQTRTWAHEHHQADG